MKIFFDLSEQRKTSTPERFGYSLFVRFLLAVEQAPAGNSSRGIAYKNIIYNLLEKQEKNNLQIVYKYFRKKIKAEK